VSVRRGRRRVASAAPAILIVAALAGCGGDGDGSSGGSGQGVQLGDPISLADCTDWNEGSVEERVGTIDQIREFTGAPIAGTAASGRTLGDEQAYDLFERYCANEFARGFKLYKLYGRAAAFSGPSSGQ
jgi:hypothetical protein